MELVGKASKRDKAAIRAAFGDAARCLPAEYVDTLARYGPGELNGFLRFPDPTERGGLHEQLQRTLRERGRVAQHRGHWLALPGDKLVAAAVLGIDRRGAVVIATPPSHAGDRSSADDDADGDADDEADNDESDADADPILEAVQRGFGVIFGAKSKPRKRGNANDAEQRDSGEDEADDSDGFYVLHIDGRVEGLRFYVDVERYYGSELPGALGEVWRDSIEVPRIYATDRSPSDDAYDALVAGDRAAVDAAIARFAGREVLPFASVALVARLLGADGEAVDAELRADTVLELYTVAARRMPSLAEAVPLRDLRRAMQGQTDGELLARLVEAAHLRKASLFDEPAVAADNTGDVPDAVERGLIVPAGVTIDLEARVAEWVEAWRAQDPRTSIDELLAHLGALPKVLRDGYLLLVARLDHSLRYDPAFKGLVGAEEALAREMRDAWPALVLALRSRRDWQAYNALELLHEHRVVAAVPYLRSVVECLPAYVIEPWFGEKAYVELAQLRPQEIKDLLLPMVAPDAKSDGRRRRAVDELLEPYADDERVFAMYLSRFIPALPFSDRAITRAKRWNDPRVIPALRTQLELEGRFRSAGEAPRDVEYGDGFGVVAKRLAKLGDEVGKAALVEYRRSARRARARYL